MKNTVSLTASSKRIRHLYLSKNRPVLAFARWAAIGRNLLGGLLFGLVLAGLLLLLLL